MEKYKILVRLEYNFKICGLYFYNDKKTSYNKETAFKIYEQLIDIGYKKFNTDGLSDKCRCYGPIFSSDEADHVFYVGPESEMHRLYALLRNKLINTL